MKEGITILLVEDDRLDVKTIERAFDEIGIQNPLYVVSDGEQALAYLRGEPPYTDSALAPRPDLILLDLNLPVMSGLEFLKAYRDDPAFNTIPSVVLTTSAEERDIAETYRAGIAGYIKKPIDFPEFIDALKRFEHYWSLCALP